MTAAQPETYYLADLGPALVYFMLAVFLIFAGLALRFISLGLPVWLVKYGGSVLWAIMVYALLAAILVHRRAYEVAIASTIVATAVELFRLYHSPALDAFRVSLAGALLFGRVFSAVHLALYPLAIVLSAAVDAAVLRPRLLSKQTVGK